MWSGVVRWAPRPPISIRHYRLLLMLEKELMVTQDGIRIMDSKEGKERMESSSEFYFQNNNVENEFESSLHKNYKDS